MKSTVVLLIVLGLVSCRVEPQPIHYGQDGCNYCQMNIVDARYGAQIVTNKGKVYKFDAVECLLNFKDQEKFLDTDLAHIVVNTIDNKGKLVSAKSSFYLRSPRLPSPMGKYITPLQTLVVAEEHQAKFGGEIYDWERLNTEFYDLPSIGE